MKKREIILVIVLVALIGFLIAHLGGYTTSISNKIAGVWRTVFESPQSEAPPPAMTVPMSARPESSARPTTVMSSPPVPASATAASMPTTGTAGSTIEEETTTTRTQIKKKTKKH